MTGRELRTCENCTPFPCPSDSDCTSTAALAGTGLVVPSGQAAEPPSGCTCAGAECTRGEFRDHQGDSPGCMACADLDPDQPCFVPSGQAAEPSPLAALAASYPVAQARADLAAYAEHMAVPVASLDDAAQRAHKLRDAEVVGCVVGSLAGLLSAIDREAGAS